MKKLLTKEEASFCLQAEPIYCFPRKLEAESANGESVWMSRSDTTADIDGDFCDSFEEFWKLYSHYGWEAAPGSTLLE